MVTYNGERIVDAAFAEQVYEAVARIPCGKVATYGQIAALVGDPLAGREVGHIMSCAPSGRNLPCHRVVNRTGVLAPDYAFGGQEKQRALLEAEGVTFLADGRIDMALHLWGKYEQFNIFYMS